MSTFLNKELIYYGIAFVNKAVLGAYRVSVYTMRRTAATKVYKKFGIVHAKRF